MTQRYSSVAIGTAATLLAIMLLLLRAKFQGCRPGRGTHEGRRGAALFD
jgi:hypothetical protein